MEKLVYTIWKEREDSALASSLRAGLDLIPEVLDLQINLPDPTFTGGQGPIRNLLEQFDGLVSLWLQSRTQRAAVEEVLAALCDGFHGYAVNESQPMTPQLPAPDTNGRIDTLSQVCLLRKPDAMTYDSWLSTWLESHTQIAIDCQTTIAYVQNIVQAPVTDGAPIIHGIVEECFPVAAYGDLNLFFGAPGDPAAMQANIEKLMASTAQFAPLDCLDRIFTAPFVNCQTSETRAEAIPELTHA